MIRVVSIFGCALILGACVSPAKVWKPTSDVKVKATAKVLNEKVATARATAVKSQAATQAAQASAQKLIALSADVQSKLAVLKAAVPKEAIPLVDAVSAAVVLQTNEEAISRQRTTEAVAWDTQLAVQLADAEKARLATVAATDEYAVGDAGLAQDATNERADKIKVQKALIASRFGGFLMKAGAILFVVVVIGLVILWFMGKLSLGAAAVASKL